MGLTPLISPYTSFSHFLFSKNRCPVSAPVLELPSWAPRLGLLSARSALCHLECLLLLLHLAHLGEDDLTKDGALDSLGELALAAASSIFTGAIFVSLRGR